MQLTSVLAITAGVVLALVGLLRLGWVAQFLSEPIVTGFVAQGSAALPTLLGEASRLIVLAGLLWGVGDLAILLIDVGHDVRAARILLARQTHAVAGLARRSEPVNGASPVAAPPVTPGSV